MTTAITESERLKKEMDGLFRYIQRVRQEIASIHHPEEEEHDLVGMTDHLDAIIVSTEKATNAIMATVEKNEAILDRIRGRTRKDEEIQEALDLLSNNNMEIIQACSFQDLTGQRVSKVLKSIRFVEERVESIMSVWGREALEKEKAKDKLEKTADQRLLHGPQLEGQGLDQAAIDALFD